MVVTAKDSHLWVIITKRTRTNVGYHSYFFGCICGSVQRVNEDQFLNRESIKCDQCEWKGLSNWTWLREQVTV